MIRSDLFWSAFGLALIGAAAAIAWFCALKPLQEARAGTAPMVSYSMNMFVGAPLVIILGVFLLVGGAGVAPLIVGPPRTREQHLVVWPMMIIAFAAGFAAWWWFDGQLHALGYRRG